MIVENTIGGTGFVSRSLLSQELRAIGILADRSCLDFVPFHMLVAENGYGVEFGRPAFLAIVRQNRFRREIKRYYLRICLEER